MLLAAQDGEGEAEVTVHGAAGCLPAACTVHLRMLQLRRAAYVHLARPTQTPACGRRRGLPDVVTCFEREPLFVRSSVDLCLAVGAYTGTVQTVCVWVLGSCMHVFFLVGCVSVCLCVCVCVHVVVLGDPTLSAPSEGEGAEVTGSPQVHAGHGHVWRGESQQDGSGQEKGLAQVVGYVYHQWVLLARQQDRKSVV